MLCADYIFIIINIIVCKILSTGYNKQKHKFAFTNTFIVVTCTHICLLWAI